MQLSIAAPVHILLIEQDDEVRKLFITLFKGAECTVSAACEPVEALDMVKQQVPDVVFSSIVFKDMDGFELCRRLRAMPETASTMIVALTGHSENAIEEKIAVAGFDKYLLKPVSIYVLLSLLDRIKERKKLALFVKQHGTSTIDIDKPPHKFLH